MTEANGERGGSSRGRRRSFWVWFLLVGVLLVAAAVILILAGLAALMKGQAPSVQPDSTLVLSMETPLQEAPADPIATELFHARIYTLNDLRVSLQKAAQDDRIKSVLLDVGFASYGFGKLEELRGYLTEFKKCKKPVWAYFEMTGNGGYFLASAAIGSWRPPPGRCRPACRARPRS